MDKPLRILILEDSSADAELALYELRRAGIAFEATIASNRDEFRRALTESFDVVLADFNLPQFDAFGAIEEVQAAGLDTPVIVVTGALSDEDAVRCIRAGAADYLIKDRLARLGQAVSQAIAQREARAAERAARRAEDESRMRLHAIFRSTREGILLIRPDGRCIDANPAALALCGLLPGEEANAFAWDAVAVGAAGEERLLWESWLAAGIVEGEFELRSRSGEVRLVEIQLTCDVVPDLHLVMLRDITERRRVEEAMKSAQKIESLGVMAGGVAHDFNNFLVAVLGNADLALEELPEDSPVAFSIEQIKVAAKRAADLARQMVALTGRGQFVVEPVDLNYLVGEMARLLRATVGRAVTLDVDLAPGSLWLEGDPTQIRQVLLNLTVNASDAIGDSPGTITITTGRATMDTPGLRQLFFGNELPAGDYVSVTVRDSGPGMDAATQARIFDPFFTTKFTGRGLGLAAVAGAVRGHRGAVGLRSRPGEGAEFTVFIPAGDGGSLPGADLEDGEWRGDGLAIVVDDEESVRDFGTRVLAKMGFAVHAFADGRQAVDALPGLENVRIALLDVAMPTLSGEETLRAMKRLRPALPVIMMSGYSEEETGAALPGQLAGFIQKPFEIATLRRLVRMVLTRSEEPARG